MRARRLAKRPAFVLAVPCKAPAEASKRPVAFCRQNVGASEATEGFPGEQTRGRALPPSLAHVPAGVLSSLATGVGVRRGGAVLVSGNGTDVGREVPVVGAAQMTSL